MSVQGREQRTAGRRVRCACGNVFQSAKLLACKECRSDTARTELIAKLHRFERLHGRAPTTRECGACGCAKRYAWLPHHNELSWWFGTFNKAIKAAGLTPRARGLTLNADGMPRPRRRTVRRIAPQFAPDFLLALPELRLLYARAMDYDGTISVGGDDVWQQSA